jgi:cytochrome c553
LLTITIRRGERVPGGERFPLHRPFICSFPFFSMNSAHKICGARYKYGSLLALGLLAPSLTTPAQAGDIEAGRTGALSCAVCHGANGISQLPNAPHLAGQPAIYVVEQLKDFRSGKRSHEIMNLIAKPLSDTEISDLAAWFESIKIEVRPR